MKVNRPRIVLTGGQLKSLEAGQRLAKGLELIEETWGIHSVVIRMRGCFICPDVDWRNLDATPTETLVRSMIMEMEEKTAKLHKRKPYFWFHSRFTQV